MLPLRLTPLLHPLLLPLMPNFPSISSLACRRSLFFFFFDGLKTQDIHSLFINEYSFFIFASTCALRAVLLDLN